MDTSGHAENSFDAQLFETGEEIVSDLDCRHSGLPLGEVLMLVVTVLLGESLAAVWQCCSRRTCDECHWREDEIVVSLIALEEILK